MQSASRDDDVRSPLLGGLVGYRLRRATGRMMNDLRTALAPHGMRPMLYAIMELIAAQPGIIQMAVGTELGIQRANLVPLINDLVSRGLVERQVAAHDRRAMSLYLTAAGKHMHRDMTELVLEHEQRTLASLPRADRERLMQLLDKVALTGTIEEGRS
ncbi:MAG: MarR family winged helix-turn-helix transcriptional regulator [Sphingomicrobium sp.]